MLGPTGHLWTGRRRKMAPWAGATILDMAEEKKGAASSRPRRRLLDDPKAPLVPAELEKWESRGGLLGGPIAIAVILFFLFDTHPALHEWVPSPTKGHPHRIVLESLVLEFWLCAFLAVAMLVSTFFNKRQILAVATIMEGLFLFSFGVEFAFPFVVFGIWLMLRASRRTRQLAQRGEGRLVRPSGRAKDSDKEPVGPAASKRYTPPKKRAKPTGLPEQSVGIGRGGMIRGDLPKRVEGSDEPEGVMRIFAGRKKEPGTEES